MDINAIKNKILEKMNEMPLYLQEAINSSGWEKKIFDIGKKYNLHIDDLDYLQIELSAALVGLSDQHSFSEGLKQTLGLSEDVVNNIVQDINDQIFSGIREKIKEGVDENELPEPEKDVLSVSGVDIGNIENTEPKEQVELPKEEKVIEVSNLEDILKEEKPKTNLNTSVFKTKTISIQDKDSVKIDPYREPLE